MRDIPKQVSNTIALFDGELVVGNHDSITLFGIQAQNRLKDYSKSILSLMLRDTEKINTVIDDAISQIDSFNLKTTREPLFLFWKKKHYSVILSEYTKILDYIEDVTLYFKLQQTQIIKVVKYLEILAVTVATCSDELKKCIETASELIKKQSLSDDERSDQSENAFWFSRLEKKLADLSVSYTLSLQSQEQIKLLRDNNLILLDRIASIITTTFPIWQTQMAILLGINFQSNQLELQNEIIDIAEKEMNAINFSKDIFLYTDKIAKLNATLKCALNEMNSIEKKDCELRNKLRDEMQKIEGGTVYE